MTRYLYTPIIIICPQCVLSTVYCATYVFYNNRLYSRVFDRGTYNTNTVPRYLSIHVAAVLGVSNRILYNYFSSQLIIPVFVNTWKTENQL